MGDFLSSLTSFSCEHLARSVQSGPASGYKFPLCLQPPEVLYFLASPHSVCSNSLKILAELLFCVSSSIYPRLASFCFSFILGVHFFRFWIFFFFFFALQSQLNDGFKYCRFYSILLLCTHCAVPWNLNIKPPQLEYKNEAGIESIKT